MEVILFASLLIFRRRVEARNLFSASIFWRTFYPRGATEVEFPFFHIKRLQAAKIQGSTRTLSGDNRLPEARVLRYRGRTHLTATSSGGFNNLFLRSFLRAMRGHLLRVGASLAVIIDQSK